MQSLIVKIVTSDALHVFFFFFTCFYFPSILPYFVCFGFVQMTFFMYLVHKHF